MPASVIGCLRRDTLHICQIEVGKVSKPRKWQPHGTVGRYRQGGCADLDGGEPGTGDRCSDCRLAMSEFNRNARTQGSWSMDDAPSNVTSINGRKASRAAQSGSKIGESDQKEPPIHVPGPVERAVITQTMEYAADNPAAVEMAKVAARILDNPDRSALHPTTFRNLDSMLQRLAAAKKTKSRGRLAAVQSMTAKRNVRSG